MYYISSFLSRQDEEMILANVDNTPKPKWTQLSNRRVINYGGVPHPHGMIAEELPKWLKDKVVTLNNLGEIILPNAHTSEENYQKIDCSIISQVYSIKLMQIMCL